MADEQTMSKVTKLNTHLRNRQEVQRLVDMIQIASYPSFDPETPPPPKRPVVKWRDINKDLGVRPSGLLTAGKTSTPSKPATTVPQEHSDSDTELIGESNSQAGDAWLDGPRTTVQEPIEKSRFLGGDVVDIGSSIVHNLLSSKQVIIPVEAEDSEASSIKPSTGTARSKDPFAFLPGLK